MILKCLNIRRVLLGLVLITTVNAQAGLGEDRSQMKKDQAFLGHARAKIIPQYPSKQYTVDQMSSATGRVTFYHNLDGICFAVAWRSTRPVNISSLLGKYADEHSDRMNKENVAARSVFRNRRTSHIASENIVVDRFGVNQNFAGRAYIRSLLPAGVSPNDIQ